MWERLICLWDSHQKRVCRHAPNLSNSPCLPTRTVFYSTKFYGGRYDSNNIITIHHPQYGRVPIHPEESPTLLRLAAVHSDRVVPKLLPRRRKDSNGHLEQGNPGPAI